MRESAQKDKKNWVEHFTHTIHCAKFRMAVLSQSLLLQNSGSVTDQMKRKQSYKTFTNPTVSN